MSSPPIDLVLLVPTRGRPRNITRLIGACAATCTSRYLIHFGFDDDDPYLQAGLDAADGHLTSVAPRMGLAPWTNRLAFAHLDKPRLCSIGDDMVPETPGWDTRLCAAAGPAGLAYPNDHRRDDIPECVVIASSVVRVLGWFCEPSLQHWYVDNVWRDLGLGTDVLRYLPDVHVVHHHPNVTGDRGDPTYWDAAGLMGADLVAYQRWRMYRMKEDIAKVRRLNGMAV